MVNDQNQKKYPGQTTESSIKEESGKILIQPRIVEYPI